MAHATARLLDVASHAVETRSAKLPGGRVTLAIPCVVLIAAFAATPLSIDAQIGFGAMLFSMALLLRTADAEATAKCVAAAVDKLRRLLQDDGAPETCYAVEDPNAPPILGAEYDDLAGITPGLRRRRA